ncbi:hypothetical protein ABW19_dt0210120 [Dactylella cylindrospora]|nr:hypothetical protein ABW19_dt0210120 [Dactylella cylindrospora]
MSPAVLEDSNMHDAPPLDLGGSGFDETAVRARSPQRPQSSYSIEEERENEDEGEESYEDEEDDDFGIGTRTVLSNQIGHLKIQSRSAYVKLDREKFRLRRALGGWQGAESVRALPRASLRTGLCYDVRMRFHATLDEEDVHPEDPRRIHVIFKAISAAGLTRSGEDGTEPDSGVDLMLRIKAREVTEKEALLVHTSDHWQFLTALPGKPHLSANIILLPSF